MLQYLVFRLLSLVAPLPPPGAGYWLCDRIGDALYWLLPRRRRTVARNLSIALGSRDPLTIDLRGLRNPVGLGSRAGDLDGLTREVFREGVKYYYDTFRVPALSDAELERLVSVEGWERLERALQNSKGAILFTAHLGSPALVAQIVAVRGRRITAPAEPVRPRKLFDLMSRVRGSRGIKFVPLGPGVTRELVEALKRNEIVGVVVDRDVQKTGVPVGFFGAETTLAAGPVMLALRTGAPLMPAFTYRRPGGRFDAHVGEPLELERTGELRRDVRLNTQKLARVLEGAIERNPEQWIVFEPVWPQEEAAEQPGVAS